jgi:hypothetical protein
MTNEEEIKIINNMSREEMCHLWRFAPAGHKYFQRGNELSEIFEKRFKELGGFSPEISKSIGWEK